MAAGLSAPFAEKFLALGYERNADFQNACIDNKMLKQFVHHTLMTKKLAGAEVSEKGMGLSSTCRKVQKIVENIQPASGSPLCCSRRKCSSSLADSLAIVQIGHRSARECLERISRKVP